MSWFLFYLPPVAAALTWLERMREVRTRRETIPGVARETLTFNLFMISGVLMFAGGITEYFLWQPAFSWPRFLLGALLTVASFVIRRKAIAALGQFWSLHVEIRESHELVKSGPFHWMRHPVYFSMFLELLGPGLMLGAWRVLALVALIFLPTMWWRLRTEEAAMVEKFGPDYEAYRTSTPTIFPFRRPRD